ncbi:MAG: DUF1592 domain-containing protein [Myxococcota bacterium]
MSRYPSLGAGFLLIAVSCSGTIGDPGLPSSGASGSDGPVIPDRPVDPPPPVPACTDPGVKPSFMPTLRLTRDQYTNVIQDLFEGQVAPSDVFPRGIDRKGYSTHPEANVVSLLAAEDILRAAEEVGAQIAESIDQILPCASSASPTCAQTFINTYGKRAFRRPLTRDEQDDLAALFVEVRRDTPFAESIGIVTTAILQMPQFLYVLELGQTTSTSGIVALTNHELAQRLGLLFLNSLPDAPLIEAADRGELSAPEQLQEQAERLLNDPRSQPVLANFFKEWLEVEPVDPTQKNAGRFPQLDDDLAASIDREFEEFIKIVLSSEEDTLDALFSSREAMVNRPLAELYGLDPSISSGVDDWVSVQLPEQERAGVLTRAALLSTHAHRTLTSPVFRGHLVRTQILCDTIPNPPPDANSQAPAYPEDSSPRTRSEILQAAPTCGTCHVQMDPIGLGFENFDAIGAYRTEYLTGEIIDNSGEVLDNDELDTFAGGLDLSQQLATADAARGCVPKQLFRYMYGRKEGERDKCSLIQVTSQFNQSRYSLRGLLTSMVLTDTFRYRTTAEDGVVP